MASRSHGFLAHLFLALMIALSAGIPVWPSSTSAVQSVRKKKRTRGKKRVRRKKRVRSKKRKARARRRKQRRNRGTAVKSEPLIDQENDPFAPDEQDVAQSVPPQEDQVASGIFFDDSTSSSDLESTASSDLESTASSDLEITTDSQTSDVTYPTTSADGLISRVSLSSLAVSPMKMEHLEFLLAGSLQLELKLSDKLSWVTSGYMRLPTDELEFWDGTYEDPLPGLFGPFWQLQRFHVPVRNHNTIYPTLVMDFGLSAFQLSVAYTAKGDPAAQLQVAWQLGRGFMLQAAIGGVVPVSATSKQIQRDLAVSGMLGSGFTNDTTRAELTLHYGRALYSSSPGLPISIAATREIALVNLAACHLFTEYLQLGGGMSISASSYHDANRFSWMSEAYGSIELILFGAWRVQLALAASGIGAQMTLPNEFTLSLGMVFETDVVAWNF